MGNVVGLARIHCDSLKDIRNSISEAVDLIDFKLECTVESVAIKPNLCYYWDSATGYTTDPRIVAGIIDWVREKYGEDIRIRVAEADASAMRTKYAFPILGDERLAE